MKRLFLEDLRDMNLRELKDHIAGGYAGTESGHDYGSPTTSEVKALRKELDEYDILIAYESVGSWGCDSSSYFLLRNKKTKKLYEASGSHCSCYGFEGQWDLQETSLKYLQSEKFYLPLGGYDEGGNVEPAQEFIRKLK